MPGVQDLDVRQARALAHPTRAAIVTELRGAPAGCTVAELSAAIGIGEATVRKHLDQLVDLGWVRAQPQYARHAGRPRLRYWLDEADHHRDAAYERLAGWLLSMRVRDETPVEAGVRIGLTAEVTKGPAGPDALVERMRAEGFAPTIEATDDGAVVTFHRCPYTSAVLTDRATVCALHQGYAEGIVRQASGGALAVTALEIRDPRVAGCRLHVTATGT
jgi:predicted ArsR family transcriptional regulator